MTPRRLFALDQNFPEPVLAALESVLPAELVPVRKIDPKLSEVADWELLLALHQHPRPWDGLITNDDAMLKLPKELVVLSQTKLTLVVAKGEGHNPIRAVGALLCHLSHICHQTNPQAAQIWTLRVAQKPADAVDTYLETIAKTQGTTVQNLIAANRIPAVDLQKPKHQ
jgi:hypothetical protein